jgi:hypothetical protein
LQSGELEIGDNIYTLEIDVTTKDFFIHPKLPNSKIDEVFADEIAGISASGIQDDDD